MLEEVAGGDVVGISDVETVVPDIDEPELLTIAMLVDVEEDAMEGTVEKVRIDELVPVEGEEAIELEISDDDGDTVLLLELVGLTPEVDSAVDDVNILELGIAELEDVLVDANEVEKVVGRGVVVEVVIVVDTTVPFIVRSQHPTFGVGHDGSVDGTGGQVKISQVALLQPEKHQAVKEHHVRNALQFVILE